MLQQRVAIYADSLLLDGFFFFFVETLSWEMGVLLDVSIDLVQDLIAYPLSSYKFVCVGKVCYQLSSEVEWTDFDCL
jgi:hypothetical protein